MHFAIRTTCDQVYLLAELLGDLASADCLRVPIREQPARRAVPAESLEAIVGHTVTFTFLLASGAVALRGCGTLQCVLRVPEGLDLELASQRLEGPAATLVWELQRQLRSDRRSRPSIPPVWDDDTVRDDGTIPEVKLPAGVGRVDVAGPSSGTFMLDLGG